MNNFAWIVICAIIIRYAFGNHNAHHFNANHGFGEQDHHDHHSEIFQNVTSKAMSVDDWLFSEDLFPGHVIPHNIHHSEAVKLFNTLLEDNDLLSKAYDKYRVQHNKEADGELDIVKWEVRKMHFRENLHFIFNHNLKADVGQFRFQVGVNLFADMSREEMSHYLGANDKLPVHHMHGKANNGSNPNPNPRSDPHVPPHVIPPSITPPTNTSPFPHQFDFRDLKLISPVKNQNKCGSCVFFSHAAMIEALHAIKTDGEIINVSEQMMLDCATRHHGYENNNGCDGNIMEDTGRFLMDHGVTTEEQYKYLGKQDVCAKEGKDIIAQLVEYWQVDATPEAFKHTLVNLRSPIAIAFYVYPQFMFYRAGVYDWCMPPNGDIGGHAMMITGYGHFFDTEYYIVKNSWGKSWGEAGYIKYIVGSNQCHFERFGFAGKLI